MFHDPHADAWIAQAIEYDISASGPTVDDAKVAFERVVAGYLTLDQRNQREPFSTLRPAPQVFVTAWKRIAEKQTQALRIQGFDAEAEARVRMLDAAMKCYEDEQAKLFAERKAERAAADEVLARLEQEMREHTVARVEAPTKMQVEIWANALKALRTGVSE